ncbi:NAD(P)-dependent glycerol-3-phosphate dehydrogenase [bacterium]|nr:NAD(P)-dependent glycerol-3-phosphate dehydrogenase [bacterium]
MKIAVLGAGSWGTALATHLTRAGQKAILWGRSSELVEAIKKTHTNARYLKTETLPDFEVTADLQQALQHVGMVVFAIPSEGIRELAQKINGKIPSTAPLVSTSKGLEHGSLKTMSEVLAEEFSDQLTDSRIAVLSGPSFAIEVIRSLPTAVTVASKSPDLADLVSSVFHAETFRVYASDDVVGVELGGVVKNVIAIAMGIVDGLGSGANARAALLTRGIAETARLMNACGAKPETVTSLGCLGDLILTAMTDLSRNRRVGLGLAEGKSLTAILQELGQVAEGVKSAEHVSELALRYSVEMPITKEVYSIIRGEKTPQQAMKSILSRPRGSE